MAQVVEVSAAEEQSEVPQDVRKRKTVRVQTAGEKASTQSKEG